MMAPSLSSEVNDLQELLMGELVPPSQGSLSYPCELTEDGWVNAASGKPLAVGVTYWKPYVETTLPRNKPERRIGPIRADKNDDLS